MMNLRIKTLLMILLIFISSLLSGCSLLRGIIPSLPNKEASPVHNLSKNTYYVSDGYSTIQAAVNAANPGDTIIVRDGTYTENVDVNKDHLTIKSENGAEVTIVQAADPADNVFTVIADCVNIDGFTVKGSSNHGISLRTAGSNISHNRCSENIYGITLEQSTGNKIIQNTVSNNIVGIELTFSSNNNTIVNNTLLLNRDQAIVIQQGSDNNTFIQNTCSNNWAGIWIYESTDNIITQNTYLNNDFGIYLYTSSNNKIYLNNFVGNANNVHLFLEAINIWNSPEPVTYTYSSKTYTNYLGNYWGDYNGNDANGDGIGDTPYSINSDKDNYPLIKPFENYVIGEAPPIEIEVTKWGITNLWESSTLHRFLNEVASATGYSIDCIIDVYVANDDPIWLVEIKLSTGEVIALSKKAPGHYSMHLQRYMFSRDRYLNYLSALAELLAKSLGCFTFRIPTPEYPPEIAILEIIITDREINIHHITWSEAGQVLPEWVPTYESALSVWISGGGTLFLGHSPVDLLVENPQGRRVGALYESGFFIGEINEIPDAFYGGQGLDLQFIYIPDSFGDCVVEVIGRGTGDYILDVLTFEKEEDTTFTATDIPTASGAIHQYTIDWDTLSQGEEGVTLQIDFDGDGTFELTITAGSTFIFIPATIDIDPDTLNLKSKIKWVTAYIELPGGYDVADIDVDTVKLWYEGNNVPAEWGDIQDGTLMVKFNGKAVQDLFAGPVDATTVAVAGELQDGIPFGGTDTIRVIKKP